LQHRDRSAGIVSFNGEPSIPERRLGLSVITSSETETNHQAPARDACAGHVRYSTTGETILRNVGSRYSPNWQNRRTGRRA